MVGLNNEQRIALELVKSPEKNYNANSISKSIGISSMGALKILKNLLKREIILSEKFGKASLYKPNFNNNYARDYFEFALKTESENSPNYTKRWINDLKRISEAEIIIIFGSVLIKGEKANDIDVLFIVKSEDFRKLKNEIDKINQINDKKVHPVYQSMKDFEKNLIKKDKIILNSIKGIFVKGQKEFLEILKELE